MAKLSLAILTFTFVALAIIERHVVSSVCCQLEPRGESPKIWGHGNKLQCGDGATDQTCCGVGQCNIFCCNCDGGCRAKKMMFRVSRSAPPVDNHAPKEEHYDLHEAHQLILSGKCGNYTGTKAEFKEIFNKFDKDGDGKLTLEEMDT